MKNRSTICLVLTIVVFTIIYFLISVVPHFTFQTNAFDLGIFNQAIQQYAHLQLSPNTIRSVPTLFSDHIELTMILFSPLYWLFGSYTLLLVQISATIFGAFGVYMLVKKETQNKPYFALAATIVFLLFFGVFTALAFDYHNNVIGTMLIPWLLYFLSTKNFKVYYLILLLFLLSKENMALISAFLGISILMFEDKKTKKHGLITLITSIAYFFVSLKVITYLNGSYDHWPYTLLGDSPVEALKFVLLHPIKTFTFLINDPIKIKMWGLILASGGIFALFKPKYFILLIPVIGQKFFADSPNFWGYTFHYSVEFAPIIAIGSVIFISNFKKKQNQHCLLGALILANIAILTQVQFYNGENIFRIFSSDYYSIENNQELEFALSETTEAVSVSAQNTLVPHLKNEQIYIFPEIANSDYVILDLNNENLWPLKNKEEMLLELEELQKDAQYAEVYYSNKVYLFKKNS
jgi:uncharacterized membrane protein